MQNVDMKPQDEYLSKEEVDKIHRQHQNALVLYKKALKEVIG